MTNSSSQRGFALLIAVILASVTLSLALALLDISYKQVTLASAAKNSHAAFAAADTALECALYHDQKLDRFNYSTASGSVICGPNTVAVTYNNSVTPRTRTFTLPCSGGNTQPATVTVYKSSNAATLMYASGYSSCNATDLRRVERGLKISY